MQTNNGNNMNQEEGGMGTRFQEMVFEKALLLYRSGEKRGIIHHSLGPLEVFIQEKPEVLFTSLVYPNDGSELANQVIYLGGDE